MRILLLEMSRRYFGLKSRHDVVFIRFSAHCVVQFLRLKRTTPGVQEESEESNERKHEFNVSARDFHVGVPLKFRCFRTSPSLISRLAVRTLDNYEIKYKMLK